MKTYSVKAGEIEHRWYVVDAGGKILGRVATEIARILRGKHKPTYTPHVDTGDFVIVINAEKVKLTGAKATDKMYYSHSGYPGAIKRETYQNVALKLADYSKVPEVEFQVFSEPVRRTEAAQKSFDWGDILGSAGFVDVEAVRTGGGYYSLVSARKP